jgi:predicted metal-dependent phosphoesterase TrpH
MHALMDAGYTDSIFGDLFHKLFDRNGGLAYVSVKYPDVYSVISEIHGAGGVAVLAHPGVYDSYELLEELAKQGLLEGVEVFHPRNKPGDVERLSDVANRYGLAMTGGTDFHGMYSSNPTPLGTCTTPEEQLEVLKKCRDKLTKQLAGA